MLTIIHTSDWHFGLHFCGYNPINEYELFFNQLTETVSKEKPDALLIVGDVFDLPTPPKDLFLQFEQRLAKLHEACDVMQIIIIAGNHDDSQWLDNQAKRWEKWGVHFIGELYTSENSYDIDHHIITIPDAEGKPKGYIIGIPYMTPATCPVFSRESPLDRRLPIFMETLAGHVARINTTQAPVVMMAHCFVFREKIAGSRITKAAIALNDLPLDSIDYFALGHYHSSKNIGSCKIHSCGSPWPITPKDFQPRSFSVITIKGRKGEVKISERRIRNKCPLVLIPNKPAKIDTALKEFEAFPKDQLAFINLYVRTESDVKKKEIIQRCKEICIGKKAHLCSIIWVHGDRMRFSNIADTNYLNHGQSFSKQKAAKLPTLITNLQSSIMKQLTDINEAIEETHRKEDFFNEYVNSIHAKLQKMETRSMLQEYYAIIKNKENFLLALMQEPQYDWEEQFIELYKKHKPICNVYKTETANDETLVDQKKELSDKANFLYKGIQYTDFELRRHDKKLNNLKKFLDNQRLQDANENQSGHRANAIILEYIQKKNELEQLLQVARARIQSIEHLLDISLPKTMDSGVKIDNLIEQLNDLQKKAIEFSFTLGQTKDEEIPNMYLIENLIQQTNYYPALWSTEIWKDPQFIDIIIKKHSLYNEKRDFYRQTLNQIQEQIHALETDIEFEGQSIDPMLIKAFLEPILNNTSNDLKAFHSELERERKNLLYRLHEIDLIFRELNESENKEDT